MSTTAHAPAAAHAGRSSAGYAERNARYWRRNLAVCVFGSFTTLVSLSMLLPFLPLYVRQLGVDAQSAVIQWSGVAFGATFLGTAVTAPLWGRLADRFGRKPMLVRAALGMAVVMSLIGVAHNVVELVALRLIAGLVGGYASASTVMVGTQAPRERAGWALGILSTGALAGNLVGPLVGGLLPGWLGIRGTFFAGGAMIAVAALLTIVVVKEDFDPATDAHARHARATSANPARRTDRVAVAALLVTAMMVLLANMSIEPIITVYIGGLGVDGNHLARIAGVVMAGSALGSMLTAARLGALADRIGSWNVIVGCLLLTALAMLPQAFVTHWWQLAALRVLMGMTLAGLLPSIGKLVRQSVDERATGQMLGYLQSAQFGGQVIGPVIGGQIGVALGLHSVFFVTAALLAACAALAYRVRSR
ncbi:MULTISPECIES: MFS transporter [unclassified Burkholderia]|uniref:MFS transporter n=1 Tax=unclassified Burkholderia TaxID=2613784 RepID=UPI000F57B07A|nr:MULTISPECIES: MFS transporter [unclassified Burkholderia]RQR87506.1 MFS transporter [Burkholderia sp. Bp9011]RQR96855.1 MFS transporter [Burkholderia sp. Bp9010]RQS07470.1 MFS transporter [Burkholderia sp. Bp8991]RQS30760.1 MFS transporter [Burkholderia sp. Bp8995]RQS51553.1 MFS transporter [Burkholderia sp. Bp8989]